MRQLPIMLTPISALGSRDLLGDLSFSGRQALAQGNTARGPARALGGTGDVVLDIMAKEGDYNLDKSGAMGSVVNA
jgi:hypothetical protein